MNSGLLVGLTGRKRSGKSTIATILKIEHAFDERSFAAPIREFTCGLLDLPLVDLDDVKEMPIDWLDNAVTPRQIMQRMGTEFGREMIHPEVWVRRALHNVDAHLQAGRNIVISDVRFANEAKAIREKGGVIVHVRRPAAEAVQDGHVSEKPLPVQFGDFFVHNDCHIDELEERVASVLNHIHLQRAGQAELALRKPEDKL